MYRQDRLDLNCNLATQLQVGSNLNELVYRLMLPHGLVRDI